MSKTKFKLDLRGLNAVMKGSEMQAVTGRAALQIAASAGDGFEAEPAHALSFDSISSVYASTWEAKKDNSDNNTLDKAVRSVSV